ALAALYRAEVPLNSDTVRDGLARVSWPGRFEEIRPSLILDGAHNPHAAKVLAETWRERFGDRKALLIFSAVAAKDVAGILRELVPIAAEIFICPVDTPRAISVAEIAGELPEGAPPHRCFESWIEAFKSASQDERPILIAGSLFLVGEARAHLTSQKFQSSTQ
ncbi:MAG: glutamate ligase domain-containing protein, partial [Luteolibacter sp.]